MPREIFRSGQWRRSALEHRMAAAAQLQRLLRWRRGGREWAMGACGFGLLVLATVLALCSWARWNSAPGAGNYGGGGGGRGSDLVPLILLRDAVHRGAVCLDGTPPGYHIDRGFGTGESNWIIHLEGGGWCNSVASCSLRTRTLFGSSNYMQPEVSFQGILSRNQSQNPDFYNWNRVRVRYCDGASFSGNVESEDQAEGKLFFRGQRIWEAIVDELMGGGLANANMALLTGCSAGGLATFIHCDEFRTRFPKDVIVKCLADAGFFLDVKDISGKNTMRSFYHDVVNLHGVASILPKDCINRLDPTQEITKSIRTPLFILNPTYDFWQVQNVLAPESSDPTGSWVKCKADIYNCGHRQIEMLHEFRHAMIDALSSFRNKEDGGLFLNSCYAHCQTMSNMTWYSANSPRVGNKTIAEAVGDWYFDRGAVKAVDCPFPCNPTCYHMRFG